MIIECPNCNKKFNLDENLIPDNGRSLKCSSCKHIWHYKTRANNDPEDLRLAEDQINKINIESTDVYNEEENNETIDEVLSKEKIDNTEVKAENGKIKGEKNKNIKMIITYFIVLIISLLGFIILLDTFKMILSNIFPSIIPFFDSIYETILDLKLFFKDLVN